MDLFGNKKRKLKEQELEIRQKFLDDKILESTELQKENTELQNKVEELQRNLTDLAGKNYTLNQELKDLIEQNRAKENILLQREERIKSNEKDIEERLTSVRKEEIVITAQKAEARKLEQQASDHEKNVIEREKEAKELKEKSDENIEKYQNLYDDLEAQKGNIKILEEEAERKNNEADEKERIANEIFEKAEHIDEEIKKKEEEFEKEREEIENSLKEKIAEYDRRLEDLQNAQDLIDDINYDESEDGKAAKIVVKEAIRQAKKSLTDIKIQFDELDEKYCNGTFKGFSTPIAEIDKCFDDLKTQYQQIKEHIEANELPNSILKWLDSIEDYLNNADKNKKSWEFSESFRNIIFGLATCKNYELLLTILNEWGSSGSEESSKDDDFTDWYDILEIEPDATPEDIKKKYREMVKKYHPDKASSEEAEEYNRLFILIKKAYEILKDINKRNEFDEKRNNRNNK